MWLVNRPKSFTRKGLGLSACPAVPKSLCDNDLRRFRNTWKYSRFVLMFFLDIDDNYSILKE